jgi:hypothetical protein
MHVTPVGVLRFIAQSPSLKPGHFLRQVVDDPRYGRSFHRILNGLGNNFLPTHFAFIPETRI